MSTFFEMSYGPTPYSTAFDRPQVIALRQLYETATARIEWLWRWSRRGRTKSLESLNGS